MHESNATSTEVSSKKDNLPAAADAYVEKVKARLQDVDGENTWSSSIFGRVSSVLWLHERILFFLRAGLNYSPVSVLPKGILSFPILVC